LKILVSRISPDVIGGAELSALDQVIVLNELGHDAVLVTNLIYLKQRAKALGIKTYWFPWINRGVVPLRYILFLLLLPLTFLLALILVRRIKPDIINPHSREDQNAFTLTKRFHKKPVVWKDPGDLRHQFEPDAKNPMRKFYSRVQRKAILRTDYIYFLNHEDQANMIKLTDKTLKERSSAVPSSILYRYYDRNADEKPHGHGVLVIGVLARLEENKGHKYIIEAVKGMKCPRKVEFWFINDGAYKPELEAMAEGIDCIKFRPFTTELSSYLATFDVLIHAAEAEGWGRVVKEAMYYGVPVVGSRVGGIKMQIEDGKTGLLFDVGDVKTLQKHLKKLINDKDYRLEIGKKAKIKADTDGDFVRIVEQRILPIYKSFLA